MWRGFPYAMIGCGLGDGAMITRKVVVIVALAAGLGGCASAEKVAEQEDGYCASIGLKFGSPDYANCRMGLRQEREARRERAIAGIAQSLENMKIQEPARNTVDCTTTGPYERRQTNCR